MYPRERPSVGPDYAQVGQPVLAVGPNMVITVFGTVGEGVWYSKYDPLLAQWTDMGAIPSIYNPQPHSASIAYDTRNNTFVAAARTGVYPTVPGRLLTSRFGLDTGTFEEWVVQREAGPPAFVSPRIVAGDPWLDEGQELYVVCKDEDAHHGAYFKSHDSGQTWVYDEIYLFADPNQPVVIQGAFMPAVWQDGPLYVAYVETAPLTKRIHFLKGTDMDVHVYWEPLYTFVDSDATEEAGAEEGGGDGVQELTVPLYHVNVCPYLPGFGPGGYGRTTVPHLAPDPYNPNRLYVVYHDTVGPPGTIGETDVNVYLRVLTRNTYTGYWTAGARIKVNNESTYYESDQFAPTITVDPVGPAGRIHIIFYDDRRYTDGPSGDLQPDTTVKPKFDVYYAWAPLNELDFTPAYRNQLLYATDPDEPALDWTVQQYVDPFYYGGVGVWGDKVWTTYTGTWSLDPFDKSVISSNRAEFFP